MQYIKGCRHIIFLYSPLIDFYATVLVVQIFATRKTTHVLDFSPALPFPGLASSEDSLVCAMDIPVAAGHAWHTSGGAWKKNEYMFCLEKIATFFFPGGAPKKDPKLFKKKNTHLRHVQFVQLRLKAALCVEQLLQLGKP